jgi:hypothetical protein
MKDVGVYLSSALGPQEPKILEGTLRGVGFYLSWCAVLLFTAHPLLYVSERVSLAQIPEGKAEHDLAVWSEACPWSSQRHENPKP